MTALLIQRAPRPVRTAAIAANVVVLVILAATVIGLALQPHSTAAQIPTLQLAVRTEPIPNPFEAYVKTPWGTRCQVAADDIICDTCEPGLLLDTPAGMDCPGPSLNQVAVDSSGAAQSIDEGVILPASLSIQQLSDGQTYHVNGWTIAASGWVRFTNDQSGHGIAVSAQNFYRF